MKLKWKRMYSYRWKAKGKSGTFWLEVDRDGVDAEFDSNNVWETVDRSLGWAPTQRLMKKRCQDIEDWYCGLKRKPWIGNSFDNS